MNGLRAVQNLLKSNAKSDELQALEMLKDWKASINKWGPLNLQNILIQNSTEDWNNTSH